MEKDNTSSCSVSTVSCSKLEKLFTQDQKLEVFEYYVLFNRNIWLVAQIRWTENSGEAGEVLGLIHTVLVVNQTET